MDEETPIIEINARLEFKEGKVLLSKLVTNEMPFDLMISLIGALDKAIKEYYNEQCLTKEG